ncbi:hypothetical protein AB0I77_29240 [Streptomyces sp. NPDC050619]|uniref:hypothetical protein n=1 Tax=Streptomyces sp. NPDC050619 TaxID=3157214 RepID=UPI003449610E
MTVPAQGVTPCRPLASARHDGPSDFSPHKMEIRHDRSDDEEQSNEEEEDEPCGSGVSLLRRHALGMATSAQAYSAWTIKGYAWDTEDRAKEDIPGLQQQCRDANGQVSAVNVYPIGVPDNPNAFYASVTCCTR